MTSLIFKFAMFSASLTHDLFDALAADAGDLLGATHALEALESGGAVRAVVEAAGIKDIRSKCLRSNNPNNVVAAAFQGLKSMRGPAEVARIRGKSVEEIVG